MYLKYGDYTHGFGETAIAISAEAILDQNGLSFERRERWDVGGELQAASQADLTTAILALQAAYSSHGKDLRLLLADGSTDSAHKLLTAQCVGGTMVRVPPSFPQGTHGQYSTFRSYNLAVEGIVRFGVPQSLRQWDETIEFQGTGGPRMVVHEIRNGPPIVEIVSQATPIAAVQSGTAVGYDGYPAFPAPIWPDMLDHPNVAKARIEPQPVGTGASRALRNWTIRWLYPYIFAAPPGSQTTSRRP